MTTKQIPRINPRLREASEQYLINVSLEKRVRLQLLKQKLMQGKYRLNSNVLAKSLVAPGQ